MIVPVCVYVAKRRVIFPFLLVAAVSVEGVCAAQTHGRYPGELIVEAVASLTTLGQGRADPRQPCTCSCCLTQPLPQNEPALNGHCNLKCGLPPLSSGLRCNDACALQGSPILAATEYAEYERFCLYECTVPANVTGVDKECVSRLADELIHEISPDGNGRLQPLAC
mmetsp:Transcript_48162/g.120575  ORF Transcript_48162/g.120575 Transcript_48162/m.120575 type:complete len:167 (-) Transcript_48162:2856-3356(-)